MNGIIRKEQFKQESIIRHLWFKMNDVSHPNDKKRLDKRIRHHVKCLDKLKQQQKVAA